MRIPEGVNALRPPVEGPSRFKKSWNNLRNDPPRTHYYRYH